MSIKIGVVIQARMSSKRLPGKSLALINDMPLLGFLLQRLKGTQQADLLAVATSDDVTDQPIVAFCHEQGIPCYSGSLHDVAGRMISAARYFDLDAFVRICGDSPLIDHRLVDLAIGLFRENQPDMVTNLLPRSFPKGQSIEVIATGLMERVLPLLATSDQHEHLTSWMYEHQDELRICCFSSGMDWSEVQMSVDTPEDLERVRRLAVLPGIEAATASWTELLAGLRQLEASVC